MKKLSEEEYVGKLKKDELKRKKYAAFLLFFLVLCSAPLIYYSLSIYSETQILLSNLESGNTALENEAIAYVEKNEKYLLGFGIGSAISAAYLFIGASFGFLTSYYFSGKKERMLIKYYDLYKNSNA